MEKDFHYYLIYAMAKITKLNNPDIVAYASQFVDDNNEGQFSINGEEINFPQRLKANGGYYYPIMTQSLSPISLDPYVQKYVYVPFHFLPGDNNVKIKGVGNPLSVTPNSTNARAILSKILDSDNPYLIGIALHTFADTWSHQNFTGLREEWNSVYPWYNVFKSIVPNIGHAEAGHAPDVISEPWIDYRFGNKTINNKERTLEDVKEIYTHLQRKTQKGFSWDDVKNAFKKIVDTEDYDERIKAIGNFLKESDYGQIPKYSKDTWIDDALEKNEEGIVLKPNFTASRWYNFHQAAKIHFGNVMGLVKEIL
ncbi:MAG: hypothetical protein GXO85_04465 [Chlorobi bacterium]|nr:hypothetical protein [Chlorobiota bacterium]